MRLPIMIAAASLMLSGAPALADQTESCASKALGLYDKPNLAAFKAFQKICKGLDDGAVAAFDAMPAGDGDFGVEGEEMDDADFDFAKLTVKANKLIDKLNATVEKGGAECAGHLNFMTPLGKVDQTDVEADVAAYLDNFCR